MDKEQVIQLLDDLLKEHEEATEIWIGEFVGNEIDKNQALREHKIYQEKVARAKEYLNEVLSR